MYKTSYRLWSKMYRILQIGIFIFLIVDACIGSATFDSPTIATLDTALSNLSSVCLLFGFTVTDTWSHEHTQISKQQNAHDTAEQLSRACYFHLQNWDRARCDSNITSLGIAAGQQMHSSCLVNFETSFKRWRPFGLAKGLKFGWVGYGYQTRCNNCHWQIGFANYCLQTRLKRCAIRALHFLTFCLAIVFFSLFSVYF